jgi:transmembrane sensor
MRNPLTRGVLTSKGMTMLQDDGTIRAEAAAWFVRLRDDADADWIGFTAWLEMSQTHLSAYEAIAEADADLESWLSETRLPASSNDNAPLPHSNRYLVAGWAVAAAIALAAGYQAMLPNISTYAVETQAGQHRAIALSDGTRIDMNGDTRLLLRKDDSRFAALDRGEAAFTVVHHADKPFTLAIGNDHLQDVGTVFNVVRTPYGVTTEVAEGSVLFNPQQQALRLDAGKMLTISADGGAAQISDIRRETVAAWRHNKLVYDHAPLSKVADDISRNLGVPVSVAPDIAGHMFSGVIKLGGEQPAFFARLALLLDVTASHHDNSWRLASRASASH